MPSWAAVHHVERNLRGICVQFGGSDRQQQAIDKYAHNSCGREYRTRWGYRWNRGKAFGEGEFPFLTKNTLLKSYCPHVHYIRESGRCWGTPVVIRNGDTCLVSSNLVCNQLNTSRHLPISILEIFTYYHAFD